MNSDFYSNYFVRIFILCELPQLNDIYEECIFFCLIYSINLSKVAHLITKSFLEYLKFFRFPVRTCGLASFTLRFCTHFSLNYVQNIFARFIYLHQLTDKMINSSNPNCNFYFSDTFGN